MATKRKVYFDKTEVVVLVKNGSSVQSYNLVSNNIVRIVYEKCKEYKFVYGGIKLFPYESERIVIVVAGSPGEIVVMKSLHKEFFDTYKEEFSEYAKQYRIQLIDNTQE